MGLVCSCMASTFLLVGEIFSTLLLAVGEVGAIVARGVFALLVGLCDVMAACACCCQVPWSERPDRGGYTYTTLALRNGEPSQRLADKPKFSSKSFASKISRKTLFALPSSIKSTSAKKVGNEAVLEKDADVTLTDASAKVSSDSSNVVKEKEAEQAAAAAKPAPQGWFGAWFSSPSKPEATVSATPAAAAANSS